MGRWLTIIFGSLYVIAMWAVLYYIIRRGLGPYFQSKRQGKVSVPAKVKSKVDQHDFHSLNWEVGPVSRQMVFECEDGAERDYDVPDEVWDWTEEGDDGVLIYQGYLFVGFEPRRPRNDLDIAYERLTRK